VPIDANSTTPIMGDRRASEGFFRSLIPNAKALDQNIVSIPWYRESSRSSVAMTK